MNQTEYFLNSYRIEIGKSLNLVCAGLREAMRLMPKIGLDSEKQEWLLDRLDALNEGAKDLREDVHQAIDAQAEKEDEDRARHPAADAPAPSTAG